MSLLKIENMRVEFPSRRGSVVATKDVNLELARGEILGIVGESGAGKSTIANAVLDLLEPPGIMPYGKIYLEGERIDGLSLDQMRKIRGKRIGMIFQDPLTSLNPLQTIQEQLVETIATHLPLNDKQAKERAIEMLDKVGIADPAIRIKHYPHQFSGGMRQRVMIAMALACNPVLLIADEPTTALDVTIQAQIVELVKQLQEQLGMALIWITHDLGVVAGLAERVIVMYAGMIMEDALVDDLYENPRHPYTRALLRSLPRMDGSPGEKLETIEGLPPDLIALPKGCPFAARCKLAQDICFEQRPPLEEIAPGRRLACWVDVDTGELR